MQHYEKLAKDNGWRSGTDDNKMPCFVHAEDWNLFRYEPTWQALCVALDLKAVQS